MCPLLEVEAASQKESPPGPLSGMCVGGMIPLAAFIAIQSRPNDACATNCALFAGKLPQKDKTILN